MYFCGCAEGDVKDESLRVHERILVVSQFGVEHGQIDETKWESMRGLIEKRYALVGLDEEVEAPKPLAQGSPAPTPVESTPSESEIDHEEEDASSSMSESALVTSEEIDDYGEDVILFIRRGCKDIMTMTIIAEDDLFVEGGSISAEDLEDYGEDFVEIVRVIADEVRLELGGYPVHGYRCRTLTEPDIKEWGEDLIDLMTKIAYEEAGWPEKFNSLIPKL